MAAIVVLMTEMHPFTPQAQGTWLLSLSSSYLIPSGKGIPMKKEGMATRSRLRLTRIQNG